MPRTQRLDPSDGWHHVMNRGVDRGLIFVDDRDRTTFCRLLIEMSTRFEVEVHSYCLMGDHFHALIRCPNRGVSSAIQWLAGVYAQYFNDRHDRVGHLFGGRFVSRLLLTHRYIVNVVRYIDRNPLDLPSVRAIEGYRWSSHRAYIGRRRADWLHTELVTRWLGGVDGYAAFVARPSDDTGRTCLGATTAEELLSTVDLVIAESRSVMSGSIRPIRRAAALHLSTSLDDEARSGVAELLGIPTSGALRTAESRARRLRHADPNVRLIARRSTQLLSSDAVASEHPAA